MAIEIERKFLVIGDAWRVAEPIYFCQGYLSRAQASTVRVRLAGEQGFITIKGKTAGISRAEFEYPVPLDDAKSLLKLCEQPLIEKYRRFIEFAGNTWEVDEFLGENAGLVVAEIELTSEQDLFERPDWIGEEVTDDSRYYNANLVKYPFKQWS